MLADLEERIGAPLATRFDLIAGTSVGGIVAIGLANEVPVADIRQAFEYNSTRIFSNRPAPLGYLASLRDLVRSACRPIYGAGRRRETITSIIGAETRIGNLEYPCLIPTVCLTKGGPQIFKTDHHPDISRDYRLNAVDVAMPTSAAPNCFPIPEIAEGLHAGCGLYANSPDLIALHEAEHFFEIPPADIRLLSIGTTTSEFFFSRRGHPLRDLVMVPGPV